MVPQNGFFTYRGRPAAGQALGPMLRIETRDCPDPSVARAALEALLDQPVSWRRA